MNLVTRILLFALPVLSLVKTCNAQMTYEEIENLYGLCYFLFRNEQMTFNKDYIINNKIKSIQVMINYKEVNLKSIYIYAKDGDLNRIKIPYGKKGKFKTVRYESHIQKTDCNERINSTYTKNRTIEFLNNKVAITQFIREDTIREEVLVIKSDTILVDHYYCAEKPLKTEVEVFSKKNDWYYFTNGKNIFHYNFVDKLLGSISSENRDDFQIVYTYCYY